MIEYTMSYLVYLRCEVKLNTKIYSTCSAHRPLWCSFVLLHVNDICINTKKSFYQVKWSLDYTCHYKPAVVTQQISCLKQTRVLSAQTTSRPWAGGGALKYDVSERTRSIKHMIIYYCFDSVCGPRGEINPPLRRKSFTFTSAACRERGGLHVQWSSCGTRRRALPINKTPKQSPNGFMKNKKHEGRHFTRHILSGPIRNDLNV